MNWRSYEKYVFEYIKEKIEIEDVSFEQVGGSDSTLPDIQVYFKDENVFNIEIKMPKSQTSQFVVLDNNEHFVFSENNKVKSNVYSRKIIEILNENYDFYKTVDQKGMDVPVPIEVVFGWIASTFKSKSSSFIATTFKDNEVEVFELNSLKNYFNAKTVYRRKKSGSSSLPKTYDDDLRFILNEENVEYELKRDGKKAYINSNNSYFTDKQRFFSLDNNFVYYLSEKSENNYEVRKLSNTNNPNVIFELELKVQNELPEKKGLLCIEKYIRSIVSN